MTVVIFVYTNLGEARKRGEQIIIIIVIIIINSNYISLVFHKCGVWGGVVVKALPY
jgi:hypothetical protein